MKILLDECVTKKLKPYLAEHQVLTVTQMEWNGLKNGKLLEKAVNDNFDLLLTIDKNILYQQKVEEYNIIVAVFDAPSSSIRLSANLFPVLKNCCHLSKKENFI